jgi:hypothetical protein
MAQGTTRGVPIDIDPLLAADSDLLVPSQKAIKTYADTKISSVSATSPMVSTGGTSPTLLIPQATSSADGYLNSTDWSTFNNKQNALGFTAEDVANKQTNLTASATKYPTVNAVNTGLALKQNTLPAATTSVDGYLTSTDWNTFNNKCYAINLGANSTTYLANNTYYFGIPTFAATTASAQRKILIPKSGTIKGGQIYVRTSVGTTSENWTLSIRLNNASNTTFATVGTTALEKVFGTTSLNIAVVAGDFIEIITTTPAWVTPPGSSFIYGTIIIQ